MKAENDLYLFCAWPWDPPKSIADTMHMSIYTDPLNIVPPHIHNLHHPMQ